MKTGWRSVWLGKPIYIVSFLMVYTPLLGLGSITVSTVYTWITCGLAMVVSATLLERYWYNVLNWWEIIALLVAAVFLFIPSFITGIIGVLFPLIVVARHYKSFARQPQVSI